jgi:hypothetical protein
MCEGKQESQIGYHLAERIRQNPEQYLHGYSQWIESVARSIFDSLQSEFAKLLSKGLVPDRSKCLAGLQHLLKGRLTANGVQTAFMTEFKSHPDSFVHDYFKRLNDEGLSKNLGKTNARVRTNEVNKVVHQRAKRLVQQAVPALCQLTPKECKLNQAILIQTTIHLLREGTEESQIGYYLAERIRQAPERYFHGYSKWVETQACSIFDSLQPEFAKLLPEGLVPDRSKCLVGLQDLLKGRLTVSEVPTAFMTEVESHPDNFVRDYSKWLNKEAKGVFDSLQSEFAKLLPEGLVPDRSKCLAGLQHLLEGRLTVSGVQTAFMTEFKSHPDNFIRDYPKGLSRAAEAAFSEAQTEVLKRFPLNTEIKKEAWIVVLENLLKKSLDRKQLIKAFAEEVVRNPQRFFYTSGELLEITANILDQAEKKLPLQFPLGATLKRQACITLIQKLIESGTSPEQLAETFMKHIVEDPHDYFNIPRASSSFRSSSPYSSVDNASLTPISDAEMRSLRIRIREEG